MRLYYFHVIEDRDRGIHRARYIAWQSEEDGGGHKRRIGKQLDDSGWKTRDWSAVSVSLLATDHTASVWFNDGVSLPAVLVYHLFSIASLTEFRSQAETREVVSKLK